MTSVGFGPETSRIQQYAADEATSSPQKASLQKSGTSQSESSQNALNQNASRAPVKSMHSIDQTSAVSAKPEILDPPLRIRPIDNPIKWLSLIEGRKGVAINTLYRRLQKVLKKQVQNQPEAYLDELLACCDHDPVRLAVTLSHGVTLCERAQQKQEQYQLQQVQSALEEAYTGQINAGLNTAETFALYSQDGELRQQLRYTYYASIVGKRSINALFSAMTNLLGEARLATGMMLMQKALNEDLNSGFPSSKVTPQLSALMADAAIVNKLINLLSISRDFLSKISRFVEPTQMTEADFTQRVVNMTTSSFYLRELQRLTQDAVGALPQKQVVFLNHYYALLKRLPDVLWASIQQRNNTLVSVLRYMDELTFSAGDTPQPSHEDENTEAVKSKLVMQAGIPVIESAKGERG